MSGNWRGTDEDEAIHLCNKLANDLELQYGCVTDLRSVEVYVVGLSVMFCNPSRRGFYIRREFEEKLCFS